MRCRMFFSFPGKVSADAVKTARWEIAQFLKTNLPEEYKKNFVFSVYFPFEKENDSLVLSKPFQLTFSSSDPAVVISIYNTLLEKPLQIGGQTLKRANSFLLPARENFPEKVMYQTMGPFLLQDKKNKKFNVLNKYFDFYEALINWNIQKILRENKVFMTPSLRKRYRSIIVTIISHVRESNGFCFPSHIMKELRKYCWWKRKKYPLFTLKSYQEFRNSFKEYLPISSNEEMKIDFFKIKISRILHGDASSSKPADITYPGLVVTFVLSAPPEVHKRLYEEGIGEMREEGFGMLEVVG